MDCFKLEMYDYYCFEMTFLFVLCCCLALAAISLMHQRHLSVNLKHMLIIPGLKLDAKSYFKTNCSILPDEIP